MPILHWLDREKHVKAAEAVPYRLLEADDTLSAGDPESPNMLIQGDNLEALKSLLPYYAGRVKCIFIDPPYNTRSAFEHYNDNLEHSQWLALMFPRLQLLRELLAEDGSIWVTIDDNEAHYLKVIMDEVFGRGNFVATCVWEKDKGGRGDADISLSHDNILVFAKARYAWASSRNLLPRTKTQLGRFKNPDNDPRGPWRQGDDGTAKSGTEKQRFSVILPSGRATTPPPGRYWAFSGSTLETARAEGRTYFGVDGDRLPIIKRYLSEVREGVAPRTWWPADDVGTNQGAKRDHLNKLLKDIPPFETPKPEGLISRVIEIASNPGDLVLDSFAGSGTTGAVAHKMDRRWIMVELGEHSHTHIIPRMKKVIDGEDPGGISEAVEWKGGGGFCFYRLGAPIFDEEGEINPKIRFVHLAAHVWFCETHTALHKRPRSPFLGAHNGTGYYLLYNGILGDKRPDGGNVLTARILAELPKHPGSRVIYGEACRLSPERLNQLGIVFKQTPYDVKAR